MLAPGAATISTSSARASKSARKCTELLSARMRRRRRIDAQMTQDRPVGRLQPARRAPRPRRPAPRSERSSAIGPRSMRLPPYIGPVAVNRPSPEPEHLEVARERLARPPGHGGRRAQARAGSHPRRPRGRAAAASGSHSSASSAPSARAAISAASRPVVSALPPPPGLSWVSARMIGRRRRPMRVRHRLVGRPQPAGEARLGCGEGGGQPVDGRFGAGRHRRA